jgi:hypothetical protein
MPHVEQLLAPATGAVQGSSLVIKIKLHTPAGTSANDVVQFFTSYDLTTSEARIVNTDENAIEWLITINALPEPAAEGARSRGWTLYRVTDATGQRREFTELWDQLNSQQLDSGNHDDGAHRWNQLEGWLLKGYTTKLKALAMQIARMELTLARFDRLLDGRLGTAFSAWSQHFDERLGSRLQNTITGVVASETAGYVAQHTIDLRNQISQGVQQELNTTLTTLVDSRVRSLHAELQSALERDVEQSVEIQLVRLRSRFMADLTVDIEKLVQINVAKAMASAHVDVDIQTVRAELTTAVHQVAKVETRLQSALEQRVSELQEWSAAQLLALKGCMTDREVLVDILSTTVNKLRVGLDQAPCVDPSVWAPANLHVDDPASSPVTAATETERAVGSDSAASDEAATTLTFEDLQRLHDAAETTPREQDKLGALQMLSNALLSVQAGDETIAQEEPAGPGVSSEELLQLQSYHVAPTTQEHASTFMSAFSELSLGGDADE